MPSCSFFPTARSSEVLDEVRIRSLENIGDRVGFLADVTDSPDATVGLVAGGIGARDFVVRDDFIIPVGNVEAAIGTEFHIDGAEPIVIAFE